MAVFLRPFPGAGGALGDFVAQHPRLTRLALHSNGLHALGGAKLLEGVVENARHLEGSFQRKNSGVEKWKNAIS